ncbi:MAG: hypothetical protein AAF989_12475 [Planctomycetota bacterium]
MNSSRFQSIVLPGDLALEARGCSLRMVLGGHAVAVAIAGSPTGFYRPGSAERVSAERVLLNGAGRRFARGTVVIGEPDQPSGNASHMAWTSIQALVVLRRGARFRLLLATRLIGESTTTLVVSVGRSSTTW